MPLQVRSAGLHLPNLNETRAADETLMSVPLGKRKDFVDPEADNESPFFINFKKKELSLSMILTSLIKMIWSKSLIIYVDRLAEQRLSLLERNHRKDCSLQRNWSSSITR